MEPEEDSVGTSGERSFHLFLGLRATCMVCGADLYFRALKPLEDHRCPLDAFEAAMDLPGRDHPATGRGEDLLTDGNVEANPGLLAGRGSRKRGLSRAPAERWRRIPARALRTPPTSQVTF